MSSPKCCGEASKWVEISPRLKYFYCEKCKNEVEENMDDNTSKDDSPYWGFDSPYIPALVNPGSITATPINPATDLVQCDDPSPCLLSIHFWQQYADYMRNQPCNCGYKVKK